MVGWRSGLLTNKEEDGHGGCREGHRHVLIRMVSAGFEEVALCGAYLAAELRVRHDQLVPKVASVYICERCCGNDDSNDDIRILASDGYPVP